MKREICIVVPFPFKIMIRLTGSRTDHRVHILILIWEFATAYAPMRTVKTFRQTNPSGKKRRKAARELNPLTAKSNTDYANGHPYSTLFMRSYGWCGNSRTPLRDTLVVFCHSPAETNGWGFRRKMTPDQMCAGSRLDGLLFFFCELSYHTNNR